MSEEELRQRLAFAERRALVADLAAAIAHEIKNPLGPIRGYAQMLLKRLDAVAPEERERFEKGLQIIIDESVRIEDRVSRLLRVAREAHTERAEALAVFVPPILEAVVQSLLARGGEDQTRRFVRPATLPQVWIHGDPDDVHGAIVNLLDNAFAATEAPGVVALHLEVKDEELWIEVLDEGSGLVFEPHRLMEPYVSTRIGGTGLGLAIARAAVEAGGGSLELEARPDKGTCARLRFRRAPSPAE